jgi:hypothetical protein
MASTTTLSGRPFYAAEVLMTDSRFSHLYKSKNPKPRDFIRSIERKRVPADEIVYAVGDDDKGWKLSTFTCRKAKPFISQEWLDAQPWAHGKAVKTAATPTVATATVATATVTAPVAPPILDLADHEKFKDTAGNVLQIEVRGTRDYNGCYFRLADVEKAFGLKNTRIVLLKPDSAFERSKHYATFTVTESYSNTVRLFLTYIGLLRLLFTSRSALADEFQLWATKVLFTVQMGTDEAKRKFANDMLVSTAVAQTVFQATPGAFPAAYILQLGTAGELRQSMALPANMPDDYRICKFGKTRNMATRLGAMQKNAMLLAFQQVDEDQLATAETLMRNKFADFEWTLTGDDMDAFIALPPGNASVHMVRMSLENIRHTCYQRFSDKKIKGLETIIDLQKRVIDATSNHANDSDDDCDSDSDSDYSNSSNSSDSDSDDE